MNSDLVRAADPWISVWTGVTATSSLTSTYTLSLVWPTVPPCYMLSTAMTVPPCYVLYTAKTVPKCYMLSTAKTVPTCYMLSTAMTVPTCYVLSTAKTVPTCYVLSTAKTVPVTSEPINNTDSHSNQWGTCTCVSLGPLALLLSAYCPVHAACCGGLFCSTALLLSAQCV